MSDLTEHRKKIMIESLWLKGSKDLSAAFLRAWLADPCAKFDGYIRVSEEGSRLEIRLTYPVQATWRRVGRIINMYISLTEMQKEIDQLIEFYEMDKRRFGEEPCDLRHPTPDPYKLGLIRLEKMPNA